MQFQLNDFRNFRFKLITLKTEKIRSVSLEIRNAYPSLEITIVGKSGIFIYEPKLLPKVFHTFLQVGIVPFI